ncbi:FRIGIDA-like protein 5 isoform X2 [Malania oleifera]|uniref:FRIGIDA-like protein 5 isoform X2 n=1 Tax=Malania oleifera TaxID=397392 RepID=UPI0025ADDA86|nr:FRIGIDA-like protein 5 isoform X2 [Malania oleifera]
MDTTEADQKLLEWKRDDLRKAFEDLHSQASSILLLTLHWKDLEEHYDSILKSLDMRIEKVVFKEKQSQDRVKEIELKHKQAEERAEEVEAKQRQVNLKEQEVEDRSKDLDWIEGKINDRLKELGLREKQFDSARKSIRERTNEVELKEKQLESVQTSINNLQRELELREKELNSTRLMIGKRDKEVQLKEKQLKDCAEEVELKEKQLEWRTKEVELKEKELEGRYVDSELKQKQLEECAFQVETKEKQLVLIQRSTESLQRELALREGELNSTRSVMEQHAEEVKLREKEVKLKEKQLEDFIEEVDSKKNQLEGRIKEIELKEKKQEGCLQEIELTKKQLEGRAKEIELKEKRLEDFNKAIELKEKQLEDHIREIELKKNLLEDCTKGIEFKEKQLESCTKEIELMEKQLEGRANEIELKEKNLEDRFEEIELKEKQVEVRVEEVELKAKQLDRVQKWIKERRESVEVKEKQLESIQRSLEERSKELEVKEKLFDSAQELGEESAEEGELREGDNILDLTRKSIQEQALQVELEKEELRLIQKSVEERSKNVEILEKEVDAIQKSIEVRIEEVQRKEKQYESDQRLVEERIKELESKGEQLLSIQSTINECINELELKEKSICSVRKTIDEFVKQVELKAEQFDLMQKSTEECHEEVDTIQKTFDKCLKELELREERIKLGEKSLVVRSEEVQQKEKELEAIKKSTEEQLTKLELKQEQLNKIGDTKVKIEQPEYLPVNNDTDSTVSLKFFVSMDGRGLQLFLNEHLDKHDGMQDEVFAALQLSSDPGKLVVDAMQGFYPSDLAKGGTDFDVNVVRRSCILLLEQLMRITSQIKPHVKDEAMKLAVEWKSKMSVATENSLEVLGFLYLLAAYGLIAAFKDDDILELLFAVAVHRQAPELCRALGFADLVPGFIQNLIKKKKNPEAINFIFAFRLVNEFPPVPILRRHTMYWRKFATRMSKGDNSLEVMANDKELAALRVFVRCIRDYKFESEYSIELYEIRIEQLENWSASVKSSVPAPISEIQPQLLDEMKHSTTRPVSSSDSRSENLCKHLPDVKEPRSELKTLCANMDSKALVSFLNLNNLKTVRNEVGDAFLFAPDAAKLVLDAMDELKSGDGWLSCVVMLEELMRVSLQIKDEVRKEARRLAGEWRKRLVVGNSDSHEVYAFLQFLGTFCLQSGFDTDELFDFLEILPGWKKAVHLFRVLRFEDKVPDFITKLVKKNQLVGALKFIYSFGMTGKFQPGHLLKAHLKYSRKVAREIREKGKNSVDAKVEADNVEIAALRVIVHCIQLYKLESEYPSKKFEEEIEMLKRKGKKARKARVHASKDKVEQQGKNKRPRTAVSPEVAKDVNVNSLVHPIQPPDQPASYGFYNQGSPHLSASRGHLNLADPTPVPQHKISSAVPFGPTGSNPFTAYARPSSRHRSSSARQQGFCRAANGSTGQFNLDGIDPHLAANSSGGHFPLDGPQMTGFNRSIPFYPYYERRVSSPSGYGLPHWYHPSPFP